MGNAALQWAFSEAAGFFLRDHPAAQKDLARLEQTHGTGKAFTVLAQKVARAVSAMLTRKVAFETPTCFHGEWRGAGEPEAALDCQRISLPPARCKRCLAASLNADERLGLEP
jgi:hypothetical protein